MSQFALDIINDYKNNPSKYNKELDLRNRGLTEVPKELFELWDLEILILSNRIWIEEHQVWVRSPDRGDKNFIQELPQDFSTLKNLTKLQMGGEFNINWKISDITVLSKLKNLEELYLYYNNIENITCLKSLEKLRVIDISNNNISEVSPLKNLTELESIDLSYNTVSNLEDISALKNVKRLYLSHNKISDISALENLTNLERVYIRNNKEIKNFPILCNLKNIQSLALSGNKIKNISRINELKELKELNLEDNKINDISVLRDLPKLEKLALNSNRIVDVSSLKNLTELKLLNLSNNQIYDISFLQELSNLEKLKLRSNQILNISPLKELTNIDSLDLSLNKISDISSLQNLTKLRYLNLRSNQISDISLLQNLTKLNRLNLRSNQISNISFLNQLLEIRSINLSSNEISDISTLSQLINIESLKLSSNQISNISSLIDLTKMNSLDISSNKISDISSLKELINLKSLDLSENKISDITSLDALLNAKLEIIFLEANPIVDFYTNKYENYIDDLKEYFARKQEEGDVSISLPVKILMLGNYSVGKTILSNYFINDEIEETTSTPILEIKPYPKETNGKLPIAIFFDFGGQDYYHGLYRIFLSKEAINILLWNNKTDFNEFFNKSKKNQTYHFNTNYWLALKEFLEDRYTSNNEKIKDKLFLIKTHIDIEDKNSHMEIDAIVDQNLKLCLAQEGKLKEKTEADKVSYNTGLRHFKALLKVAIEKQQKKLKNQPEWYLDFLNGIYNNTLIKTKSPLEPVKLTDIIKKTNYRKRKTKAKEDEKNAEHEILRYLETQLYQLHKSGIVLYYKNIETLQDVVWLDPAGLVDKLHEIFNPKDFENSDTTSVFRLKELGLNKTENDKLITLLEKQKIIFQNKAKNIESNLTDEYIIPNFLPLANEKDPDYPILDFDLKNPNIVLRFRYFMPMSIMNQLIGFFGQLPYKKNYWSDQIVFFLNKQTLIRITANFSEMSISVWYKLSKDANIKKQALEKYLFKVLLALYWDIEPFTLEKHIRFEDKHESDIAPEKENAKIKKEIPDKSEMDDEDEMANEDEIAKNIEYSWIHLAIDNPNYSYLKPKDLFISIDNKYFVKYNEIHNITGKFTLGFPLSNYELNNQVFNFDAPELLYKNQFNSFIENPNDPKKIFISYSNEDENSVSKLVQCLKYMELQQRIKIWNDKKLQVGDEWDFKIKEQLQEADIILLAVSQKFLASKYILDVEVKIAMERHEKGEAKVVPVILSPCSWDSDGILFNKLMTIPSKDTPISKFENKDDAWLIVSKSIEKII